MMSWFPFVLMYTRPKGFDTFTATECDVSPDDSRVNAQRISNFSEDILEMLDIRPILTMLTTIEDFITGPHTVHSCLLVQPGSIYTQDGILKQLLKFDENY
jgi:hypothetical protein